MKKMKKMDNFIYTLIAIIGVLTIVFILYCIIFGIINLINMPEFSKILMDKGSYHLSYNVTMALQIFVILLFSAIPYLICSILLGIIFIRKYIKYKGEKKNHIIKILILSTITGFIILDGITLYPLAEEYEISVNSRIDKVSNIEVKEFLRNNIEENRYVYKINIKRSFLDDYRVVIYYNDIVKKEKITYLSDYFSEFIYENATDTTYSLALKSTILTTIGEALYIYCLIYLLKEFRRISTIDFDAI